MSKIADDPKAVIDGLQKGIAILRFQVEEFSRRNEWLTNALFGSQSEKRPSPPDQNAGQQLSLLGLPVTVVDSAEDLTDEDVPDAPELTTNERKGLGKGGKGKKPKNGGGRQPVNPTLREVVEIIEAPEDEKFAANGTP